MSIIKKIIDTLRDDGFDIYEPGQHKGECKKEYIVVKFDGSITEMNVSSERPLFTLMCYVPENKYSILEQMVYDVKQTMKKIYPILSYVGNETASYYEEKNKSHMISFQYQGIRKIENW